MLYFFSIFYSFILALIAFNFKRLLHKNILFLFILEVFFLLHMKSKDAIKLVSIAHENESN